ncbi:hypothetical protein P4V86_20330 [Brevibacillus laterosporus]|uniref:hypothetical protein n=1 Tax=Brevibacillus laterosporus TaxID=1465 RepID=UPI000360D117|nr:hypothetical protein [Brevibacillus laterosporus]ATO50241.1 hypothetical protein BrL25_14800 [Brevibacillus laterosporus DSM 25]MBG9803445.1 hypothetical protein [Brevibacillus laterosporus]MED2005674.1 hypothetical protein [Brevibacillus laterosporus]MED4762756.1 hypothetical protein [Brevibacillus laterosporus]TPH14322.1 hypothetical protein EGH09_13945 [Brevibacillus laterosporus]
MTYNQNYNASAYNQISGPASSIFNPNFAGTNVQEVKALNNSFYPTNQSFSQVSNPAFGTQSGFGSANSVYNPGFAGTDVQEVRALNAGQPAPTLANQAYGQFSSYGNQNYGTQGGYAGANSVFQPGFAGTNVQEVRALNAGQPTPGVANLANLAYGQFSSGNQNYGVQGGYTGANSVFQPGFAGTNTQEVRQLNATHAGTALSQGLNSNINSVFNQGFAGTNANEVQALNAGYSLPAVAQQPYQSYTPQTQSYQFQTPSYSSPVSYAGANSVFQPGFAGTNVQEVRQLNASLPASAVTQSMGSGINSGYATPAFSQQAQQSYQNYSSPAQNIFQNGFAGTNAQEVRAQNAGGYGTLHSYSGL